MWSNFYIIAIIIVISVLLLWIKREGLDIPLISNILVPLEKGPMIDTHLRVLNPAFVMDPSNALTTQEVLSRGIVSTTPESIYRQLMSGQ
jgi:hypothetical protein